MNILVTIGIIAAIGVLYCLLPVGLGVFAEFKEPKEVICPENGEPAQIKVDASYAAMTSAVGMDRRRLQGCSRWPERGACNRACLGQLAH
jgi:hypothetical protein